MASATQSLSLTYVTYTSFITYVITLSERILYAWRDHLLDLDHHSGVFACIYIVVWFKALGQISLLRRWPGLVA